MKILTATVTTVLAAAIGSGAALAQDDDKAPTLSPVEIYTCNYLDGKGRSDLDKVVTRWNKWSDANSPEPYTAWLLTPVFFGAEITFDVAWMGAWPTNKAMGSALQTWQDDGSKMSAEFFDVLSCDSHSSMAVLPMQPPVSEFPESSLVRFMDCKVDEDSTIQEAVQATRDFGKFMDSKGAEGTSAYVFFPGLGAGDIDFDYKLVLADVDYNSVATTAEISMNGGGWQQAQETFGGITSCDSARLYKADLVRSSPAN